MIRFNKFANYVNLHKQTIGFLTAVLMSVLAITLISCQSENTTDNAMTVKPVSDVETGRYMVVIGGCNDCHTPGYAESNGNVPESEWLTGSPVGYRGPWGTTYAGNLRLLIHETTEDNWVTLARNRQQNPPMPWISLNQMTDSDLRAIYRYIKQLGAKGTRVPLMVGPGQEPLTPYFSFEPQHMERLAALSPGKK